ncbi:hypothetical protein HU200_041571 [Digitaria exilis]|uniref:Uncharacterized protein n=1 Tax=Digitaria exilis TaxID=1010633 RepID=A0A835BI98_9POAL|nr:hypothetical protein HU200_041571 [Digitaria exilis]
MEEGEGFLKVLRALRDAAGRVEAGESRGPALQALLALEAGADDLLAGDPSLTSLRRLLYRLRELSSSVDPCSTAGEEEVGGGVIGSLRARCRRCAARRGIKRVAGAVAGEIQAWVDRETIARLVAALRRPGVGGDGGAAAARALLAELEARLLSAGRFDPRLQRELLRHGVFAAVEAKLGDPAVGDGCAAAVLALVRFSKDVFVGPVLMGPAVGALVEAASGSPAPLRALNGLVDAIRSPLVDELHARGELPRLVALLCAPGDDHSRVRALALEFALRVGYYGRKEVVDALLAEGLVKRLLCLQRSDDDLGGSLADTDTDEPYGSRKEKPGDNGGCLLLGWRCDDEDGDAAALASERPFASAVARFAVQVEVGAGLSPREKRETKLEILRRAREAAVSPAEEATVLTEVLWGATP